ncbi:MAG: molecular chaperone [Halarsenatibacteraceae bacterium]
MSSENETADLEKDIAEIRTDIYHGLSAGFYIPQEDNLSLGFIEELEDKFEELDIGQDISKQFANLKAALKDYSKLETLLVEYSKLFLGPDKLLAPPYGSYYLDDKVTIGESTREIIKIYEKLDLEISDSFQELPDHIALELYFMAFLASQKPNLDSESELDNLYKWQEMFLDKYILSWIDKFIAKIRNNFNSSYYLAMADLLEVYLNYDRGYIEKQL